MKNFLRSNYRNLAASRTKFDNIFGFWGNFRIQVLWYDLASSRESQGTVDDWTDKEPQTMDIEIGDRVPSSSFKKQLS